MDYAYTLQVTLNVIFIALYGMTYLYIKKLETIGCDCSNHKYRNFIKYFPVAAIHCAIQLLLAQGHLRYSRPVRIGAHGSHHLPIRPCQHRLLRDGLHLRPLHDGREMQVLRGVSP